MIKARDLLGLRVLSAVIDAGSVAAAADRLAITQPAISNAIARLRESAGDPLLVRVGNRNQPTQKALQLVALIDPALKQAAALMYDASHFEPAAFQGQMRIGTPDYLEYLIAPGLVTRLATLAPQATLQFRRSSAETAAGLLDDNRIDVALTRIEDIPRWQCGEVVLTERFVVIHSTETLAPQRRLSLRAYVKHAHAMVSFTGEGEGQLDAVLRGHSLRRQVVARVSSFASLGDIVMQAPIIATVPHPIARRLQASHGVAVSQPGFAVPPIDVSLLHARRRAPEDRLQWLLGIVRQCAQEVAAST